jgi:hypothetical protein
MTYQPNPDAPIASEQHPELYERMCNAKAFIEQVLAAYVKARKANGMTRPDAIDLGCLEATLVEDVYDQFSIDDTQCEATLGETLTLNIDETDKLIKENWNGTN